MARRARLTEASITRPSQALRPSAPPPSAEDARRAPARKGKKAIAFWVDPAASTQVRIASVNMGRSVQGIMEEALDDWFAKHGLHRLAASEEAA
jgi:Antitoxin-like ribbon-helix-helix